VADDRTLPFKERAYKHFKEAQENLKNVQALLHAYRSEIDTYREPLSYDERKEVTVLLSWGGPSDGYTVFFDKENEPIEGYYFFADWFEYEEIKLSEDVLDRVLCIYFW